MLHLRRLSSHQMFPPVVIKCESDGCADVVTIFGTKQASVAVHSGDEEKQPLDETTEFSFEVTLAAGMNTFELRAVDIAGTGKNWSVAALFDRIRSL